VAHVPVVESPSKPSKPPKPAKQTKGSLEALDPETDSEGESDGEAMPPEYAVLDMNVPRTALVINVSHVLKRLNGCCSLNQLMKSIKSFKENTGVTLEAFLRANPMTFRLEGRIVHLVDRNGEKWQPPQVPERVAEPAKGRRRGKGEGKGESKVEAKDEGKDYNAASGHGSGAASKGSPKASSKGSSKGASKGASKGGSKGASKGNKAAKQAVAAADQWSGYDEWSVGGWDESSWEAGGWKSSYGNGWEESW